MTDEVKTVEGTFACHICGAGLMLKMTRIAGTIAWYVVHIKCDNGHYWIAGSEMKGPKT